MRTSNRPSIELARQILIASGLVGVIGSCTSAATVDPPSAKLTSVAASAREDGAVFNFEPLRIGKPLTHIFMLKNSSDKSVLLSRAVSSCDCTSAIILDDFHGRAPLLAPGETARVRVDLDSAKLSEANGDVMAGGTIEKQILVYVAGENVHPAATLTLRGRLTRGVAFDPPVLSFGNVDEAKGARKTLTVTYDADVYVAGKSRLEAEDSRVQLVSKGTHTRGGQVVEAYTVAVTRHAPVGDLSGAIVARGLAGSAAAQDGGEGSAAFRAPFVGEIIGNVAAEPRNVVFGNVKIAEAVTGPQRTRWILLVNTQMKKSDAPAFWKKAVVQSGAPYLEANIVTPGVLAPAGAVAAAPALPPTIPLGMACWLQVTIHADAPHQPLSDVVTLVFPDKERVVLPVYGEVL